MIPKVIHYIWLGGNPLPPLVVKCMKSWKKYCPDYEIKRWDESNLNIDINKYCREAYDARKYAFASDVLRFEILRKEGGIYLDVDVELLKPLDDLLDAEAFAGLEMGDDLFVAPGLIFASKKDGEIVTKMLNLYYKDRFINDDGTFNYETICVKVTNLLEQEYGLVRKDSLQKLGQITVYPTEYFCPINVKTKLCEYLTENTYSKHLYLASWLPKPTLWVRMKNCCKKIFKSIIGDERYNKIKNKYKRG